MSYLTRADDAMPATAADCQAMIQEAMACDKVQFVLARLYVAARAKHGEKHAKTKRLKITLEEVTELSAYTRIAWAEGDETRAAAYKAQLAAAGGATPPAVPPLLAGHHHH